MRLTRAFVTMQGRPMHETLRALALTIWSLIYPPLAHAHDAPAIADALATVAIEDANRAPVFGSHDVDFVLEAVYVAGESNVSQNPRPQSWDAKGLVSCGAFQERCTFVRYRTLVEQAREWKRQLRAGKKVCPACPAAPLGGDCKYGQPLADTRMGDALALLREVIRRDSL